MRSIHKTVLVVCALALAACAIGAGSAFAAESPAWYTSASKPTVEWQQGAAKLTEAVPVKWSASKVKFRDIAAEGEAECEVSGEGSVGPGAAGKQTAWTLSGCKLTAEFSGYTAAGEEFHSKNACHELTSLKVIGVPWHTELTGETKSAVTASFSGEGAGSLGFAMECKVAGIIVKDECKGEHVTGGSVNQNGSSVSFPADVSKGQGQLKCSVGGAGSGVIEGTQELSPVKGSRLGAAVIDPVLSKLTSSLEVEGEVHLSVEDNGPFVGANCEYTTKGTIGANGKGTFTSLTPVGNSCKPVGAECRSVELVEARNLPWDTELTESYTDKILSGGSGTPELWFECVGGETGGETFREECPLETSPSITNGLEGAAYLEIWAHKSCSYEKGEEGLVKGEIKLKPPAGTSMIEAKA